MMAAAAATMDVEVLLWLVMVLVLPGEMFLPFVCLFTVLFKDNDGERLAGEFVLLFTLTLLLVGIVIDDDGDDRILKVEVFSFDGVVAVVVSFAVFSSLEECLFCGIETCKLTPLVILTGITNCELRVLISEMTRVCTVSSSRNCSVISLSF